MNNVKAWNTASFCLWFKRISFFNMKRLCKAKMLRKPWQLIFMQISHELFLSVITLL